MRHRECFFVCDTGSIKSPGSMSTLRLEIGSECAFWPIDGAGGLIRYDCRF